MFGRVYIAQLKLGIRNKKYVLWTLAFPLVLGTLFYAAFMNIYDSHKTSNIAVAVVVKEKALSEYRAMQVLSALNMDKLQADLEDYYTAAAVAAAAGTESSAELPMDKEVLQALEELDGYEDIAGFDYTLIPAEYLTEEAGDATDISPADLPFLQLLEELEYEDGSAMVTYTEMETEAEGRDMLERGEADAVITISSLPDVTVYYAENGIKQSILTNVISSYRQSVDIILSQMESGAMDTLTADGESDDMDSVFSDALETGVYVNAQTMGGDNKDPYVSYFYNIIAMIALLGSIAALQTVAGNRADQSDTGIRIDASPVAKPLYEVAQLFAIGTIQIIISVAALTYYIFILGVNFGGDIDVIYLTSVLSTFLGCTLGFLFGHFGTMKPGTKESILMAVTLGGGFLAGLMYGSMKEVIEENCPIINRINPAAVITDAFYAINVYGVGARYYRSLIYILGLSVLFIVVGLVLARRKSYASL